ncbi:hypothetical protein CFRS1_v015144 [Colletotrichum fructicola]|nr:hypothetical protein CFRS1_v015984 [Colletotrichum fructicola]KAF4417670.1 hypothetical protein CFRS1_v015144 [Colletotrichum fructicola]
MGSAPDAETARTPEPAWPSTTTSASKEKAGKDLGRTDAAVEAKDGYPSEPSDRQDEAVHVATPATDAAEITVAIAIENRDTTDSIQPADAADAKDDADDPENGIFVIEAIVGHQRDPDDSTLFQMRVCWMHGKPTWEPESSIQEDAEEALFAYWDTVEGGREGAMVDINLWHVLKVEKHKQEATGTVKLHVAWVGSHERTWEPEDQVLQNARELVDDYWATRGGRQKHVKSIAIPVKRKHRHLGGSVDVEQVAGAEELAGADGEPRNKRGRIRGDNKPTSQPTHAGSYGDIIGRLP